MMVLLHALVACDDALPPATTVEGLAFPHPSPYEPGVAHGPDALAQPDVCGGCHRTGSTAPSCASCHADHPHLTGWLAGSVHGVGVTGASGAEALAACEECHGLAGLQAPGCTSCHSSWPHPPGWEGPGAHGRWALARASASAACGSCHGPNLEGSPTAPSCTACHVDYPHPLGFAAPEVHPLGDLGACGSCHEGQPALVEVPCSTCHATYPHPPDQRLAHIATAARVGEPVCLACHSPGDGLVPLPAACAASCHGRLR